MNKLRRSSATALWLLLAACGSKPPTFQGVGSISTAGSGVGQASVSATTPLTPVAGASVSPAPPAASAGTSSTQPSAGTAAAVGAAGMNSPAADGGSAGTQAGQGAAGMNAVQDADDAGTDDSDAGSDPMPPLQPVPPAQPSTGPFPAVSDFTKPGSFQTSTLTNTGPNRNYTVYLPTQLAPNGAKNPIVGWMSGGATDPTWYPLLPHLASHGFVVVASNSVPGIGAEMELGQEIIAGIDWAIAENARQASQLFGKLDTSKIASLGYSMGSLATFMIASDARLTTTVHISGGNMVADRVNNLRAPAAFLCGTPDPNCTDILSDACDIAAANCDMDFQNAKTPVFYANFPGGHLGILGPPNQDRLHAEITAWLRWQLMGDQTLKARFVGPACTVCKDPNWTVQQKNLQ